MRSLRNHLAVSAQALHAMAADLKEVWVLAHGCVRALHFTTTVLKNDLLAHRVSRESPGYDAGYTQKRNNSSLGSFLRRLAHKCKQPRASWC